MVFDREDLQHQPELSFTYRELEAITEAAKSDRDIKKATIDKLKILKAYARTKAAYEMGSTILTAR